MVEKLFADPSLKIQNKLYNLFLLHAELRTI